MSDVADARYLLELPTDRPRPRKPSGRYDRATTTLPGFLSDKLRAHAAARDVSLASILLAGYQALLHRYTGQDAIAVGFPICAAPRDDGSISYRGGARAFESSTDGDATFASFTAGVAAALGAAGTPERVPALQALFDWDVDDDGPRATADVTGDPTPYELALRVTSGSAGIVFAAQFATDVFTPDTVRRFLGHLIVLLEEVVGDDAQALDTIPILTDAERHQILDDFNATAKDFPADKCLHELFEARAAEQPDAPAVVFGGETLTYRELNERANRLAHRLRKHGVGPDVMVGLLIERSLEMVVGLMGIAKAGGAYVPMDASYPMDRLAFMIEDTAVDVLLTQASIVPKLPAHDAEVICLDRDWSDIATESAENPTTNVTPENLIYVIYTSGSTGRPKGCMLDHRGRVSNFLDFNRRFGVGPGDRLLGISSLSFDMCAYDVFGVLACGAAIVVAEDGAAMDAGRLAELMRDHRITVWHSVPALLKMLVEHVTERAELHPRDLRLVLLGGDWIPVTLPDRLRDLVPDLVVVSMGGATEVSMDSTIYVVDAVDPEWTSIPYGAPMWNQLAYVLDKRGELMPVGVPGELWLGGIGVGRGYYNRPELTAEKFVPNPFVRPEDAETYGTMMYRTGDLARYGADGNLELLGRMDFQVKIRGFRVELGEIEAALRSFPSVEEAVVLARGPRDAEKKLVAYLVPSADASTLDAGDWEEKVSQWSEVYDNAYSAAAGDDPVFNIASWDSSYTGEPIPPEEMREWVDETVARIRSKNPKRVLEIGCGLGLLLFRIAPHCEHYHGTDISTVALDHVRTHLESQGLADTVTLSKRMAENFDGFDDGAFDAIVLNSIILDFPSADYLLEVLRGAVRVVRPGGFIFIGDVRPRFLEEAFQSSVELAKADDDTSAAELRQRVEKNIAMEVETLHDPSFFAAIPREIPAIGHVDIRQKRGRARNELVNYRYDLFLHVGSCDVPPHDAASHDWQRDGLTAASLRTRLETERPAAIHVTGIPNARVLADVRALEAIAGSPDATAATLRAERDRIAAADAGVDPDELWRLADDTGYAAQVNYAASGARDEIDAWFVRDGDATTLFPAPSAPDADIRTFASAPNAGAAAGSMTPELRAHLEKRLPKHMVPSAYVMLDALPLTPNGKINRRALPDPDDVRPDLATPFVAPDRAAERILAGMWTEVLGIDRVGVNDDFFELGGHSLLATQVISRVRETFQLELPLRALFEAPTVAGLVERLEAVATTSGLDLHEVAEVVLHVEQLSDAEAEALLAQNSGDTE